VSSEASSALCAKQCIVRKRLRTLRTDPRFAGVNSGQALATNALDIRQRLCGGSRLVLKL
jgi:hypothetical protein